MADEDRKIMEEKIRSFHDHDAERNTLITVSSCQSQSQLISNHIPYHLLHSGVESPEYELLLIDMLMYFAGSPQ